MLIRTLSIVTLALCATAACGNSDELLPFSVRLELGTGCEGDATCHDYGMTCGAKMSIRIVDAESIYQARRSPDAGPGSDGGPEPYVVQEECVDVPAADTLCGVDDVSVVFPQVPARMMQIQVALWSPDTLADYDGCPENIFDLQGQPLHVNPQPAFGGWDYFDVGKASTATVELACSDPEQLDACRPEATSVVALVSDLSTGVPIAPEKAQNLAVSVGEPRGVADGEGEFEWVLEPTDTHDLELVSELTPKWFGENVPGFFSYGCVLVLDRLPARALTSVACQAKEYFQDDSGEQVTLEGLLLPNGRLEEILTAAGMAVNFPDEGLVVGRVVSDVGAPLAGAKVRTSDPGATVEYISADWSGTTTTATSDNAYFISRDATWPSQWTAEETLTGRRENGNYVAGLISGKVTLLEIYMEPAIQPD